MDVPENTEVKENEVGSTSSAKTTFLKLPDKSDKRKGFIGPRRRGSVLAELETISENNIITDYSFHSRGNLSFNQYVPTKRISDRLSQSLSYHSTQLDDNNEAAGDCFLKPSNQGRVDLQTTPPSVLRQRIKDANEVKHYLEKELTELKEFTTAEKQILAVEKGYEALQEETSHLKMELNSLREQNSSLKMELEETNKLTISQKELIIDLKNNFDEVKVELRNLKSEKNELSKELEKVKKKLVDEEFKNEISEVKWKKREDELMKSLEESWVQLKINEDRLVKMQENIHYLYSEREIISSGNDCYSELNMEKMKSLSTRVEELFNLSCNNLDNDDNQKIALKLFKCNFKGDSAVNGDSTMNNDLKKCHEELDGMKKRLEMQDSIIKQFENSLIDLGKTLEFHVNSSSAEFDNITNILCKVNHNSVFDKISCELLMLKEKLMEKPKAFESKSLFINELENNEESLSSNKIDSVEASDEQVEQLKVEISNLRRQIAAKQIEDQIDPGTIETTDCKPSIEQADVSSQTLVNFTFVEELEEKINGLEAVISGISKPSIEQTDVSSQTELNTISVQEYEDKISYLEALVPDNSKLSIEQFNSSSQTQLNFKSVQEFEDKISHLEAFISHNVKPSILQADFSSQTQLNFTSVQEYEDKISCLEAVISDNSKASIEQSDISSQTENNFTSVKELEDKIGHLEAVISANSKPSIEQFDFSSQTQLNITSVQEYEDKISHLEACIYDNAKPFIEQADFSSQTELNTISVREYEDKISHLENLMSGNSKPFIEQSDVSSQTPVDFTTVPECEKKIGCLETALSDDRSPSIKQSEVFSQTHFDLLTVQEYEDKISHLEALVSDNRRLVEQADISVQTCLDMPGYDYEKEMCKAEINVAVDHDLPEKYNVLHSEVPSQTLLNFQTTKEYAENYNDIDANFVSSKPNDGTGMQKSVEGVVLSSNPVTDVSLTDPSVSHLINATDINFFHTNETEDTKTLSDSMVKKEKEQISHSECEINPVYAEYIELPAPDTSTFDYTFSCHLEHSILKSKLRSADLSNSEFYDPLASVSEEFISQKPFGLLPSPTSTDEEMKILKTQYRSLEEELKFNVTQNNKSLLLVSELESLLVPEESCNQNDVVTKLERITNAFKESAAMIMNEDIKTIGVLNCFKMLHIENIELNKTNDFLKFRLKSLKGSLEQVKSLKSDFLTLEKNVEALQGIDSNLSNLKSKLINLYEEIDIYKNESKDNFNNLLLENKSLKEELLSLKLINTDLKKTSELYTDLLAQHSELKYSLDKKENCLRESTKLKNILNTFIEKIKQMKIMIPYFEFNNLEASENEICNDDDSCIRTLLKIEQLIEDCQNAYVLLENIYELKGRGIFSYIEKLSTDKITLEESCRLNKSEKTLIINKLSSLMSTTNFLKGDIESFSSDVLAMKESIKKQLLFVNQEMDNLLLNQHEQFEKLKDENQNLKSKVINLESLLSVNDKYSELLKSYKDLESDLLQSKVDCSEHLKVNESLKLNISLFEIENCKLKDQVSSLEAESYNLKLKLDNLECLVSVNENYSELLKSYEKLETEFLQIKEEYNEIIQSHDSLKSMKSQTEAENNKLRETISKKENELLEYNEKIKRLEHVQLEQAELRIKLSNLESLHNKYTALLQSSEELKNELLERKENCSKLEELVVSLKETVSDFENKNLELKEKYLIEIEANNDNKLILEKLQEENENFKKQSDSFNSLMTISDKYSELMLTYSCLETELSQSRQSYCELSQLHDTLKLKNSELEHENNNFKETISKYGNDIEEYKHLCNNLELKLVERDEEITEIKDQQRELNSIVKSLTTLKENHECYVKLVDSLRDIMKLVDSGTDIENSTWIGEETDFHDIFTSIKSLLSELFDLRKKLKDLESSLISTCEEKAELVKKLESLYSEVELDKQKINSREEELTELLKKEEENSMGLKRKMEKYDHEIASILSSLKYTGELVVNEESWMFIKDKMATCRSFVNAGSGVNSDNRVSDLEKRVEFLESQLLDTDNFKRKFSRELHGLKPELCVSDLMKLSLEDLQITMISTIMEKESAVVANLEKDYETKLALSSERIHQLEEEERRRIGWIHEIESENDRLSNECKQIQEDNKNLKNDIITKIEKIEILEKQIGEKTVNAAESLSQEQEQEKGMLVEKELENKKLLLESNVQEAVTCLTKRLEEKSKECDDALSMLQNKSQTIFQLERVIFDARAEKAHLEEEVKALKEALNSQINTFVETKTALEYDISFYKEELLKVKESISCKEENHTKEKLDLQKEIESKVFLVEQLQKLENKAEVVIKHNIGSMLDGHMEKVDKLNMKIKDFSAQLYEQNARFNKLKSQDNLVESLKSEIICLKSAIALLEKEKSEALSAQNEMKSKVSVQDLLNEGTKAIREELDERMKELAFIREERNAFFQDSLECHQLKEKMLTLNKCLEQCQDEFKLCNDKLTSLQDENTKLKEQSVKYEQLCNEFSILNDNLKQCQNELIALKEEKDSVSNLPVVLKSDMSLLENELKTEITRLEREKEEMKKEFLDNLEFEKGLTNSIKLELAKKENELLNLKKEKDLLIQEYNKKEQTEKLELINLKDKLNEATEINKEMQNELLSLRKALDEKSYHFNKLQSELEGIHLNFHSEESCPYKKDSLESKIKIEEFNMLLSQEQEKFKLWKTNFEEDLRCKVLLIGDLESKLKKETHSYKDALMSVSELQHKLFELEEKLKKSEEKINMQREVFIREKGKLESEIKNKEKYEIKVTDLKNKSEELAKSINIFLEKVGSLLGKEICDLGAAYHELSCLHSDLAEEREKVKELDEECEELNKNIKYLENELGKLYAREVAEKEQLSREMSKLKEEQGRNEKLASQVFESHAHIKSLQANLEKMERQLKENVNEKKCYEINIQNLLEDKQKLQRLYTELEKKVLDMQVANEHLKKKENLKVEELMKELNYLKLQIVNKNTKISKLEMRLESDCLPFQRRADAAEKKVEELSKELKSMKISFNSRDSGVLCSSPRLNVNVDTGPTRLESGQSQIIASLQEEIKKLQKEKRSLKQLALLRHKEIKDLEEKLERRLPAAPDQVT